MAAPFFLGPARPNITPGSLVLVGKPDDRGRVTLKIIKDPKVVAEFRRLLKPIRPRRSKRRN